MILVTGGAGFIGSNLQSSLYADGIPTAIADRLGTAEKWLNLAAHPPLELIAPDQLPAWLATAPKLDAIVHLGAISATTANDGDLVWRTNVSLSQTLWHHCAAHGIRFIYASSAATYGDGSAGFDDNSSSESLKQLRPLNLYGFSKHAFDLWVAAQIESGAPAPPAWAGVKFFNVYGPNEYHKGKMISAIKVKHDELLAGGPATLFRSETPGLANGAQARDFIWVGDTVAALRFMLTAKTLSGLYNLGTGQARAYADMARAVCAAHHLPERIAYIDMPAHLRGKYQSFTQAPMHRLREAGFTAPFTSLEDGIRHYVTLLQQPNPYV
jgi:ADP-L-glycero-D-manno-heptose 6-epimerase